MIRNVATRTDANSPHVAYRKQRICLGDAAATATAATVNIVFRKLLPIPIGTRAAAADNEHSDARSVEGDGRREGRGNRRVGEHVDICRPIAIRRHRHDVTAHARRIRDVVADDDNSVRARCSTCAGCINV